MNFVTVFLAKLYNEVKGQLKENDYMKVINFFKAIVKPLKVSYGAKFANIDYDFNNLKFDAQKNLIDEFITENFIIKEAVDNILNNEIFKTKKIVVFIDDLDRCDPDKIIEVIESIKLILNSENCIFFLGCDKDYLEKSILVKYEKFMTVLDEENYTEKQKDFSKDYLEKIIQIPFFIPLLDEGSIEKYISYILSNRTNMSNIKKRRAINYYAKFSKELNQKFITKFIVKAGLNPRRVKRILNILFLHYLPKFCTNKTIVFS